MGRMKIADIMEIGSMIKIDYPGLKEIEFFYNGEYEGRFFFVSKKEDAGKTFGNGEPCHSLIVGSIALEKIIKYNK